MKDRIICLEIANKELLKKIRELEIKLDKQEKQININTNMIQMLRK